MLGIFKNKLRFLWLGLGLLVLSLLLVMWFKGARIKKSMGWKPAYASRNFVKNGNVEYVSFESDDESGNKIVRKGILLRRNEAEATVLVCHGFACNKDDLTFLRTIFPKYNCMLFDFRAHGENKENQVCTLGRDEAYDVIGAVRFLKSQDFGNKPIICYGFSMGAVAAIEAQAKDSSLFYAMILDCPFDSTESIVKKGLDAVRIKVLGHEFNLPGKDLLYKYAFNDHVQGFLQVLLRLTTEWDASRVNSKVCRVSPVESAKKITVPCYFIHCRNDEKFSIDSVKSVYSGVQGYRRLWVTEGLHHFGSFFNDPERYVYKVNKFIAKTLNGGTQNSRQQKIIKEFAEGKQYEMC